MFRRREVHQNGEARSWALLMVVALSLLLAPFGHALAHSAGDAGPGHAAHSSAEPGDRDGPPEAPPDSAHACVVSTCTPAASLSSTPSLNVPDDAGTSRARVEPPALAGSSPPPDLPPPRASSA